MAKIDRRPSGNYRIRWREAGRPRAVTVPTKADADRLKREIEVAVATIGSWIPGRARQEVDLRLIADAYIRELAWDRAARTTRRYAEMVEGFLVWVEREQGHPLAGRALSPPTGRLPREPRRSRHGPASARPQGLDDPEACPGGAAVLGMGVEPR